MSNLEVKRNELKYYISNLEYHTLKNRLKHILVSDRDIHYSGGYFIRSLYFDSFDDEALFEKNSGFLERKKYRLRIYDLDTKTVKFEIKHKRNNQVFKESAIITKDTALSVIDGNYDVLLDYNNPVLNKIYIEFKTKAYSPKVIVDYIRDAYIYEHFDIRITFDKDLRSNNTNFDIFDKDIHTIPVIQEQKQILEIKYNLLIPEHIKTVLQTDSFERMAISKYALSRRFLKLYNWEDN